ncbi:hypothetical protein KPSA3_01231 [Pseudomonas syringae pv. actinidiae]|uniref:Uncharacterized protein n=1 Tax=Pseudomonas syringae pv. actinidiae TaxID=103796 RepID=A0AAN4Q1Z9_PSESF|nr:hypothetical protein KPSA3_01231 [Pseudomonas syringae pv. actinidiae]
MCNTERFSSTPTTQPMPQVIHLPANNVAVTVRHWGAA